VQQGVVLKDGWIVERTALTSARLVPLSAIHLIGPHLVDDVMAAAAVSAIAGATPSAMTEAVEHYRGLEHAMELVADFAGVRFVNDSKATNVVSAVKSIESFDEGVVPIIGGRFKGGDASLLREPLTRRARAVVLIGEARALLRPALADAVIVHEADSLREAVEQAFALARPAGVVLLAPACSSFDMFRDYADRGRQFKAEVRRLMEEPAERER
jgi:UDP-N-acetylmuramoylalanine--D-glutamate ligase